MHKTRVFMVTLGSYTMTNSGGTVNIHRTISKKLMLVDQIILKGAGNIITPPYGDIGSHDTVINSFIAANTLLDPVTGQHTGHTTKQDRAR